MKIDPEKTVEHRYKAGETWCALPYIQVGDIFTSSIFAEGTDIEAGFDVPWFR